MTTDDLAGLLYRHQMFDGLNFDHCECGERIGTEWEDMAAHQAAVIATAGWVKGREEWAFTDNAGSTIWPLRPNTEAEAERVRSRHSGGRVIRRYVTDWEEVPLET